MRMNGVDRFEEKMFKDSLPELRLPGRGMFQSEHAFRCHGTALMPGSRAYGSLMLQASAPCAFAPASFKNSTSLRCCTPQGADRQSENAVSEA